MQISDKLSDYIKHLKNVDFKALERMEELGQAYNFRPAVEQIKTILKDLEQLVEYANYLRVSKNAVNQIEAIAKEANDYVEKIRSFVLLGNEANASSQRQEILQGVDRLSERNIEISPELIERARILQLNPTTIEEQSQNAISALKEIESTRQETQKIKENLEQTSKELRDTLGQRGASFSAADFEEQAKEYKKLSEYWFNGSVWMIALTAVLVIWLFSGWWPFASLSLVNVVDNYPRLIQIVLFKLVLLSIAYLLVYQCLKNYKVNQHLYVLNKHRQLALTVYPFMVNAAGSQELSNTILAQASKAIFDPGTTGYLDGEDNPNPINLTEIVNKVVDKV